MLRVAVKLAEDPSLERGSETTFRDIISDLVARSSLQPVS